MSQVSVWLPILVLTWEAQKNEVIQRFHHVFLQGHVTKPLYLSYQNDYDDQILQDDNLGWWTPTHKVRGPFDQVILQDHGIN